MLCSSHEPFRRLVFQGPVTKSDTGCFATPTAYAVIRVHVNGTFLFLNSMRRTSPQCVTVLAVMFADNVEHLFPFHNELV